MPTCFVQPPPVPTTPLRALPVGQCSVKHPYFKARKIRAQTIIHFGLGVSAQPHWLKGRLVIPLCDAAGEIIGYAGRWAADSVPATTGSYSFIGQGERQVFNLHRVLTASSASPIIVTGSPFDVFHLWQCGFEAVVSLFTYEIFDQAIHQLAHHFPGRQFLVLFDETERGQTLRQQVTLRLARFGGVRAPEFREFGRMVTSLTGAELEEVC